MRGMRGESGMSPVGPGLEKEKRVTIRSLFHRETGRRGLTHALTGRWRGEPAAGLRAALRGEQLGEVRAALLDASGDAYCAADASTGAA
tara:strand:- start:388 stop:654 length:267 start_codon:yes stop_codon:yes gene_type:complete